MEEYINNYNGVKYFFMPPNGKQDILFYCHSLEKEFFSKNNEELINKCQNNGIGLLIVEYFGSTLKKGEYLLEDLENRLPEFLKNIKPYLKESYQKLIENNQYQAAIDKMYFDPYVKYNLNKETVIPIYGKDNEYNDFGMNAALDYIRIINHLISEKKLILNSKIIGIGDRLGAFIIELIDIIRKDIFDIIVNIDGYAYPTQEELFTNINEWKYGHLKLAYIKKIGKISIPLVNKNGYVTNQNHELAFKKNDFDLRNLFYHRSFSKGNYEKEYYYIFEDNMMMNEYFEFLKNKSKNIAKLDLQDRSIYEIYEYVRANTNIQKNRNKEQLQDYYLVVDSGVFYFHDIMDNISLNFYKTDEFAGSLIDEKYLENIKKKLQHRDRIDYMDDIYNHLIRKID